MGNQCKPSQNRVVLPPSIRNQTLYKLWDQIKRSNFDSNEYKFILQIQEMYTDNFGAFLNQDQIQALMLEFKRFLFLLAVQSSKAKPQVSQDGNTNIHKLQDCTPSPVVDRLWRNLIINTMEYEKFCMKHFNGIIERDSNEILDFKSYGNTRKKLEQQFLAFDEKIWPAYQDGREYQNEVDGYLWIVLHKFIKFHQMFKAKIDQQQYLNIQNEFQYFRKEQLRVHPEQKQNAPVHSAGIMHKSQVPMMEIPVNAPSDDVENKDRNGQDEKQEHNSQVDVEAIGVDVDKNAEAKLAQQVDIQIVSDDDDDEQQENKEGVVDINPPNQENLNKQYTLAKKHTAFGYKPAQQRIGQHDDFNDSDEMLEPELESDDQDDEDQKKEEEIVEEKDEEKQNPMEEEKIETNDPKFEAQIDAKIETTIEQPQKKDDFLITQNAKEEVEKSPSRISSLQDDGQWLQPEWKNVFAQLQKIQRCFMPNVVLDNFQREINTTDRLTNEIFMEYKKFHILKQLVDEKRRVIPSHSIKQAWDYHIIETAQYRNFCYSSFNKFVHNEQLPRKSGMTEYHDYGKTLEIYEQVFETKPPAHIWHQPEERFNFTIIYSRKFININSYMISAQKNKKNPGLMASSTLKNQDNFIMMRQRKASMANMKDLKTPDFEAQFIQVKSSTSKSLGKKGKKTILKYNTNIQSYNEQDFKKYYQSQDNEATAGAKRGLENIEGRNRSNSRDGYEMNNNQPQIVNGLENNVDISVPGSNNLNNAMPKLENQIINGGVEAHQIRQQIDANQSNLQNEIANVKDINNGIVSDLNAEIHEEAANVQNQIQAKIEQGEKEQNQLNKLAEEQVFSRKKSLQEDKQKVEGEVEKEKDNLMASIGDGIDAVRNGSIEGGVNLKNGQAGANIVV